MQLKKIELQGFKSFADKTDILFLDGITTIVGPNGSGKSNISDAVKWVLGEQSVKNLRGSKMEDVIFAGTQARKKVGFAEVSMYLDNSDLKLPVEYREVVVTRRVYRTGESSYLINGNECRLKDIQELFMDTGLGKDGYSIISQGKIDEILSNKSEERRKIFEEASGIVKYRVRKEEASRKLENTEASLVRVCDILNEIESTIEPLKQKAEVAKEYLKLREELKKLEVKLFIQSVEKNQEMIQKLEESILDLRENIKLEENGSKEIESKKEELKQSISNLTEALEKAREQYYATENETEKLNSKIEVLNATIDHANLTVDKLKSEIAEDDEKILLLKEEIEKREKKRLVMSENKQKFEKELEEKTEKLEQMMKSLDSRGLEIESLKKTIDEQNETKYEARSLISSMNATLEANLKQIQERERLKEKSIIQKDGISAEKEDIALKLNKQEKILNEVLQNYDEKRKELEELHKQLQAKQEEYQKFHQELLTARAKYQYMQNLEQENEGYYKSVKSVLDYAKEQKEEKVFGTIANLIATDEKYEYAIEIALGGFLQNVVVENEATAKEMISYLKENSLGRVTFLLLNTIRNVSNSISSNKLAKYDGVIGLATDLIRYDKKYDKAIQLALYDTVIVESIDHAIELSKKFKNNLRVVTLAGELVAQTGSITGGQAKTKSAGLIGRKEKLEKLNEIIKSKEEKIQEYKKGLESVELQEKEIEESMNQIGEQKEMLRIEVATLKEKLENLKQEIEKIEKTQNSYISLLENLQNENETLRKEMTQKEQEIVSLDQDNDEKQKIIEEYARFHQEKQKEINFLNEDVVNLKISLSSFDESVASLEEMKEKISQDIENFQQGITRKNVEIEETSQKVVENLQEIETLKEKIKEYLNFKMEYLSHTDQLKEQKMTLEKEQEELNQSMIENVKNIERVKEDISKIENKKLKYEIDIENIKNKMWEDYELTLSSAKNIAESFVIEEKNISKKAENIKSQIKDLGEVNVSSIEEYKNTKERYDFIVSQKEDLEKAKNKLQNLINNMTSIMKSQFEKQFKIIAENFNETFKELFGGGKAELKLSDEENILTSGIEVEVEPPGKKLQNMMLLSGGERALTAIALLFAILKIKTPPFCILDEIEAALDDLNVHRFAEYIKKYSKNNQFIVITHRKGTMEAASSVYGVTMQEYGISKVVSMKLK